MTYDLNIYCVFSDSFLLFTENVHGFIINGCVAGGLWREGCCVRDSDLHLHPDNSGLHHREVRLVSSSSARGLPDNALLNLTLLPPAHILHSYCTDFLGERTSRLAESFDPLNPTLVPLQINLNISSYPFITI